ncbi:helix-turn-helix transcriptional regulator [Nocardia sp. NPDC005366]|uniref:helix-turn-helix domain-containing protein n=1 Tax=Nocardia sp. NPDC005366 TaxID=3156878 RepID=UPI0033B3F120
MTTTLHTPNATEARHAPVSAPTAVKPVRTWPVLLLALPAFVAIWSGWVGLGELTGFGPVHPLPGIADGFSVNTAITLPIGMETYASYALYVWLSGRIHSDRTRAYAKWSAFGSLGLGAVGQVAYHLMEAAEIVAAPWPVTVGVACLPVVVLGMGAALAHMIAREHHTSATMRTPDTSTRTTEASVSVTEETELDNDPEPEPVHAVSVRTDHPEPTIETPTVALGDRWDNIATRVCAADPNGRRDRGKVATILRLRHEQGWTRSRIAEEVGLSPSSITRTITAAAPYTDSEN